ncbi:hypothetical protein ACPXCG_09125 [Gordonia sp. DT218]|uniref:hypothetical protein n=1 Tax=Gordonia sp. DT218 TaxID=3416659 RepID=UPI003CE98BEB
MRMTRVVRTFLHGVATVSALVMALLTATACGRGAENEKEPESVQSLVARVVKASPGRDGSYTPPSRGTAQAVAAGVSELLDTCDADVDSYYLVPVKVPHSTSDDQESPAVNALVERGDPTAGNGLYVVRDSASPLIVQAPHPVADQKSEYMGAQLFSETDARLFMMAGAHRTAGDGSADVAHRSDSTFAAVNDAVVQKGMTVVQLHGFSSENHEHYGDVVLSDTVGDPSPTLRRLDEDLEDEGFDTCMYDGKKCKKLAGTTNVQAIAARARGAAFIHIEVDAGIREDTSKRRKLMRVIAESLRASGVG